MTQVLTKMNRISRYTCEVLSSLNIAWTIIWVERTRSHMLGGPIAGRLLRSLDEYIYGHDHVAAETVIDQIVVSILLAILIFLFLRLVAYMGAARSQSALLHYVGGLLTLTMFPMAALCFPFFFFPPRASNAFSFIFAISSIWLILELMLALIAGSMYALQKWPFPGPVGILALLVHFGFWSWLTGMYASPFSVLRGYGFQTLPACTMLIFFWGFPTLGFFSFIAWARTLNVRRRKTIWGVV
jgi:hypothetical protein